MTPLRKILDSYDGENQNLFYSTRGLWTDIFGFFSLPSFFLDILAQSIDLIMLFNLFLCSQKLTFF